MNYRGLATTLFRCSGLISMVVGLFQTAGYIPMIWNVSGAHGTDRVLRTVFLPSLSLAVAGLAVFLLAGVFGRLAARALE